MKCLNKKSTAIFHQLIDGLNKLEDHKKIKNNPSFMAVSVEVIDSTSLGPIVSVAHYYKQNGDLMADPEMTFLVVPKNKSVYPLSFRQDNLGIYQEAARIEGERILKRPSMQKDITLFANQWMENIKEQQLCEETINK